MPRTELQANNPRLATLDSRANKLRANNPRHAALDGRANELQANNPRHAALDSRENDRARTAEVQTQVRGSRKTVATSPSSQRSPDVPSEDPKDYSAFIGSLGTKNAEFVDGLVAQLLGVSARDGGKFHARELSFALAVIKGSKPPDELEAMQIAQMAAVHEAMMRLAGEVARAEYQVERESAMRAMNQLAPTYCAQLDALKRYRSKSRTSPYKTLRLHKPARLVVRPDLRQIRTSPRPFSGAPARPSDTTRRE
jgi:hypothetical protein